MKIELVYDGLDAVLREIDEYLVNALCQTKKSEKDLNIAHALGAVRAAYKLTLVKEEDDAIEQRPWTPLDVTLEED